MVKREIECDKVKEHIDIEKKNQLDEDGFISGFEIILEPYIPNQEIGKTQYFDKKIIDEDFENREEESVIYYSIPVEPEYSYYISGSYKGLS